MKIHEKYIKRCIELAKNGLGITSPNPSVGAVIVVNDTIIGEGFTSAYGGSHAEVNAINSVKDKTQLKDATIYVSLEPCNHHGKTPPCSDLIVRSGIKNVVIGCVDPFEKVAGSGIQKLKDNGCNVTVGVLETECLESNKRFFTFLEQKRPYIILKWAETSDGFIDIDRSVTTIEDAKPNWITNVYARQLVHKWRAEEDAILVGTNTAQKDNPKLDVRHVDGKNPVRVVLDRTLRIPENYHIYNGLVKTIVLTEREKENTENLFFEQIDFSQQLPLQICEVLYKHKLLSLIIEGGLQTLQSFIDANLWDEARVFKGKTTFSSGIKAPSIKGKLVSETNMKEDRLRVIKNTNEGEVIDVIKENYQSVINLWNEFLTKNNQDEQKDVPLSFYFCDNEKDANECAELVVKGIKRATATSLWWFEKNNEPLPKVGDQCIVTDWFGNAKAIIETTKIEPTPYNKITAEFAETEGEGDKSLAYWKKVHKAYYTREMEPFNEVFDESMMIICEHFKVIYVR